MIMIKVMVTFCVDSGGINIGSGMSSRIHECSGPNALLRAPGYPSSEKC